MKILIAPDSFKGALSAPAAAAAIATGLRRVWPEAECVLLPIADGGEGTLDTLLAVAGGELRRETVRGPLGEPLTAAWGLLSDGETAVVELAQAAGLILVSPDRRDPKVTTTFGVGQLLASALRMPGIRRLLIGLGGSATNDGAAGILQALGLRLRDAAGRELPPGGAALAELARVERSGAFEAPADLEIQIACDVDHPLTGPRGASAVFGPQKGATSADVAILDAALAHYAAVLGLDPALPGLGAAGGATAGLLYLFPNAVLRPGIELMLDAIEFDRHLAGADLVLTGEGRLDTQTLGGKAVAGIAACARKFEVPVAALVGGVDPELDQARLKRDAGVFAVLPIAPGPCTLAESMTNAEDWLTAAAERAARWMTLGR